MPIEDDFTSDALAGVVGREHAIKRAPFRERLPDGTLSDEYLPESYRTGKPIAHNRADREWLERRAAGSLWDEAEEMRMGPRRRGRAVRPDREQMLTFIATHAGELGVRQIEVGLMFWRDYLSYSTIAARLGIARVTCNLVVLTLRRKARGA